MARYDATLFLSPPRGFIFPLVLLCLPTLPGIYSGYLSAIYFNRVLVPGQCRGGGGCPC